MADAVRRAHARFPCDIWVHVLPGASGERPLGEGRLLDLSLSGALLSFPGELAKATPYRLRLKESGETLHLPCRVVREVAPAPKGTRRYGVLFNLSSDQERRLRELLDVVRRRPPSEGENRFDRSMRDYWG